MFDKSQATVDRGSLPYAVIVGKSGMRSSRKKSTATSAKIRAGKLRAHVPIFQRLDGFTEA
jgi:hypothetical protein